MLKGNTNSSNVDTKLDMNVGLNYGPSTLSNTLNGAIMRNIMKEEQLKDTLLVDVPKFVGETYTISTIRVEYERTPPRCSSCKVFGHVLDECPKKIVSDVLKNSKSPRQDVEGVHVGLKNFEQLKDTCNYDPYDDDDFDDCGLTDTQMKFANSFDICLPGQIR
ncbi:zinc knuckle CX2CX4HX4C containing protein [Tanacetum coccineum]|uniref:Zinc knuckle CX2CX4HX4C containing protein n=1 Tax=Tanacetum coccineum TaxID=301880 RepID=A0ABQ4ZJ91_9ASTR